MLDEASSSIEPLVNREASLQRSLTGHKKAVTCLSINEKNIDILASGSEDMTVRTWDLRSGKCSKCIMINDTIESISFSINNDHMIYVACAAKLKLYDLRRNEIILKDDSLCLDFSSDINALCLHQKGQYLALSDDTGSITIIDILNDHKIIKRLSRVHSNLVSAISFRHNFNSNISTGGFDCIACTWDFNAGRPISSTNFSRESLTQQTAVPMINPPFVQSILYAYHGKVLVCGLGDGSIRLLNPKDSKTIDFIEAHGGTITSMSILQNNEKNLVFSGGIDKQLKCWEILDATSGSTKKKNTNSFGNYSIVPLWSIDHNEKINAITPICSNQVIKVYVTDIGNNIHEYIVN